MKGQFLAMLVGVGLLFVLFWVGQYDLTSYYLARRIRRTGLTPVMLDVNTRWRIAGIQVRRRCLLVRYQRTTDFATMSLRIEPGPRLLLSEPDGTAITCVVNARGEFLCSTSRSGLAPRLRIVEPAELASQASKDRAWLNVLLQRQIAERETAEREARARRVRERRDRARQERARRAAERREHRERRRGASEKADMRPRRAHRRSARGG